MCLWLHVSVQCLSPARPTFTLLGLVSEDRAARRVALRSTCACLAQHKRLGLLDRAWDWWWWWWCAVCVGSLYHSDGSAKTKGTLNPLVIAASPQPQWGWALQIVGYLREGSTSRGSSRAPWKKGKAPLGLAMRHALQSIQTKRRPAKWGQKLRPGPGSGRGHHPRCGGGGSAQRVRG